MHFAGNNLERFAVKREVIAFDAEVVSDWFFLRKHETSEKE